MKAFDRIGYSNGVKKFFTKVRSCGDTAYIWLDTDDTCAHVGFALDNERHLFIGKNWLPENCLDGFIAFLKDHKHITIQHTAGEDVTTYHCEIDDEYYPALAVYYSGNKKIWIESGILLPPVKEDV